MPQNTHPDRDASAAVPLPFPTASRLPAAQAQAVQAALARHQGSQGALLPVLHDVQDALGHIPPAAVPMIARGLNLSRAEVHGVVRYYHHFREDPAGAHVLEVCQAEACRAMGAESLMAEARRHAAIFGWTVQPVYCLGLCASAPSVAIDGRPHAHLSAPRLDALIREVASASPAAATSCASTASVASMAAKTPTVPSPAPPVVTVYVPCDSASRAAGADAVADAILAEATLRGIALHIVRNGSRGLFWLEPLVEVSHGDRDATSPRHGFGPVGVADVATLFDAGVFAAPSSPQARRHPLALGDLAQLPWLAKQQRITFARMGLVDPRSIDDFIAHGGYAGLTRALAMSPDAIVQAVADAGLRGRGGAAFPAAIKWKTVAATTAAQKYVVCNADEGDSGTFSDRMTMEGDPFMLIEGMTIAGIATGATIGYCYIRSEYPDAIATMQAAITTARAAGWLGSDIRGSGRSFDLIVRKGAGSYVCGEETAMLESIEGRRGLVRAKPPLPAVAGLFGCPTVINNVITLATVPQILVRGGAWYRGIGQGRSTGTLPFQLAGNIRQGGLVELPFGVTLRTLLEDFGGGSASGRPIRAVQVGGPLGTYVPPSQWDAPIDYEVYAAMGAVVGHGGIVVHDETADLGALARYAMEFCVIESCGKCTPCRIGAVRGTEVIDRLRAATTPEARDAQATLLRDLCDTMQYGSLCAMGGMTPYPVLSALNHYPEDFGLPAAERMTS